MKMRANWLLVPAVVVGLNACNKKEEVKSPDAPAPVANDGTTPAVPAVPTPEAPKLGVEERAAKLGFAKHLPQDTELVLAFYNGTKTVDRVKSSKIWGFVEKQMGSGMGGFDAQDLEIEENIEEIEEAEQDDLAVEEDVAPAADPLGPAMLFGQEFTLAIGKPAGEQLGNLMKLNNRVSYFQMRALAKSLASAMKSGDSTALLEAMGSGYTEEMFGELLKDPESGIGLVDSLQMPPVYVAFRVDPLNLDGAAQQVSAMLANVAMLGEVVEPVSIEKNGKKFEGSKISGAKIAESMEKSREDVESELGKEATDQLIQAMSKKDLIVASGTVDEYVVLFLGSSVDDLKLAATPAESLVGTDALAFTDGYVTKDLAALLYGQKESADKILAHAGGLSSMTNGLRDGLAGSEGLGDTRDLEALFQLVGEREAALRKLGTNNASGIVAFFEEGLKIESFGGYDQGMFDWKSPNKLSNLGDSSDVLMFANMTINAEYDEKATAYIESILETAYAITMKVAEVPTENADMVQFQEMAKMFDTQFRPDVVSLWEAMSTYSDGLDKESAIIVDLKGGAPAVPGIPQPVIDGAKVPRVTMIAPVTDRSKVSGSWDEVNKTLTGTLAKISQMTGQDIPMQKPMSSEKDDKTTWFFPLPFFTDDFLPSVTVSDKWLATSTSKNHALEMIAGAEAGAGSRTGFWFSFDFKTLQKYAEDTYRLVDQNSEQLMGGSMSQDDKAKIEEAIGLLSDMDNLTIHARREGNGQLRSTIHFKTR